MNNPNPFVPKGSILEQQSKRRSRLKLAVFCVLALSVAGLAAMLIQGCKREQPADMTDNSAPTIDTNPVVAVDTNPPPVDTNPPVIVPPVVSNPPPVVVAPPVEPTGTEYVIVKGDTLGKIARRNGITLKELEAANPDLIPTKLKVGHKILIPAGGGGTSDASAMDSTAAVGAGGEVYVVKSGDNLSKIAKRYGTTVKEIQSENNLVTTKIKVGQKLNIPAKAEVAAPVEAEPAAPVTPAPIAPVTPPGTTSAN